MEKIEVRDGKKFWLLNITAEDVFARVSLDTAYREHAMAGGGSRYVLLEDDMGLFTKLLKGAVGRLWLQMGRMSKEVAQGLRYSEDGALLRLSAGENHDDNMLGALGGFADEFVDAWVLRQWFERNGLAEDVARCAWDAERALNDVLGVVHYRKRAVKRPIDPLL